MADNIFLSVLYFIIFIYSIVIHECAHAIVAYKLGDSTAYYLGRITLNPIKHIDPIWSIIIPLLTYISSQGSFIFGGAKPVPINPYNFRNPSKGMMLSSLAGPLSNFSLALLGFIAFFLSVKILPLSGFFLYLNLKVFNWLILINVLLGIFNLIPIPPLDGSRVLRYFLPWHMKESFDRLEFTGLGFIIIIAFIWFGGVRFILPILYAIQYLLETIAS
ncbi:MAG: site-2 protease family protein [Planctomycetota bacterium]|nr:site-2 protease family protein [Planctomycetota bacterium]MDI6786905.1 site-2 protease family protein [Planctomycetota bacterium]